jgi:hypothetical protein
LFCCTVSGFLAPGGPLKVPDNILDEELLQNSMWPRHPSTGQPVREAFEFLEYIKDNYWNGESMVEQIIRAVLPIFRYAFPGCCGWAFDNATNHNIYATDALIASRMHLDPGGQTQPRMREGFDHTRGLPYPMVFLDNHPDFSLRGKPKGLEAVLRERGLWPAGRRRPDSLKFLVKYPNDHGRPSYQHDFNAQPELKDRCCATTTMAAQKDFREQKGRLQEELEAAGQEIIFYPKFHCELNFIPLRPHWHLTVHENLIILHSCLVIWITRFQKKSR